VTSTILCTCSLYWVWNIAELLWHMLTAHSTCLLYVCVCVIYTHMCHEKTAVMKASCSTSSSLSFHVLAQNSLMGQINSIVMSCSQWLKELGAISFYVVSLAKCSSRPSWQPCDRAATHQRSRIGSLPPGRDDKTLWRVPSSSAALNWSGPS